MSTKESNVKRVGLYFNLDIPAEAKMWEYLQDKRKSYEIKKILENAIIGGNAASSMIITNDIVESPKGPEFKVLDEIPKVLEEELDNEAIKF